MPSATVPGALMAVGDSIWKYAVWQERTKFVVVPTDENATASQTMLTVRELAEVRALAQRIHKIGNYRDRLMMYENKVDNDRAGKAAWGKWLKGNQREWKLQKDVEMLLDENMRHPRQLIGEEGYSVDKLLDMMEAQLSGVMDAIAYKFFGSDAYQDPKALNPLIKAELYRFVNTILVYVWNQENDEEDLLRCTLELEADAEASEKPLTARDLDPWLKKVDKLIMLAKGFGDKLGNAMLSEQLDNLCEMHKILTGENPPQSNKGLSKNLRDALRRVASPKEVLKMSERLAERLELEGAEKEDGMELEMAPEAKVDWSEGVEHLQEKTPSELYKTLGLEVHNIPFLKTEIPTEVVSSDGVIVQKMEPFSLRWHQLVGVTKMMERAKTSEAVLLMDDVGLGKTLQVLAFFAMLAFYREYHVKNEKYPGAWGKDDWTNFEGKRGEPLPADPFLIVVPPTLVNQVWDECTRFLSPGSLDVIKVIGSLSQHSGVWEAAKNVSHLGAHMKVYVASTTALQSDSGFVHTLHGRMRPTPTIRAKSFLDKTIFGRRYLGVAIDEAHAFRKVNKLFGAVRALRDLTDVFVAMTATPVQTRPSDLWYIGKAMGLAGFKDDEDDELEEMTKELARAKRDDKKEIRHTDEAELQAVVGGYVRGKQEPVQSEVNTQIASAKWIQKIRDKYRGAVIRRTVNSLDYQGKAISGLQAYEEHQCMLEMHEHEYEALESLAQETMESSTFMKRFSSENFYLDIRKSLLHPWCVTEEGEDGKEKTYAEYEKSRSAKLDALVEIVKHHLSIDRAPAKVPSRQISSSLWSAETEQQQQQQQQQQQKGEQEKGKDLGPDKIIVYSYFPSAFWLIEMVMKANGINMLTISGGMSMKTRTNKLKEFQKSGPDGARVLLISSVGSVGLNIAFANVLIILDVLWSVLTEQQLIGRVWRYPQPKTVHVYRLIGARSPDIFLNNISFSKGFIQDTFSNIGSKLKEALELGEEEDMMDETSEEGAEGSNDDPSGSRTKGKGAKGKAKAKAKAEPKAKTKAGTKGKGKVTKTPAEMEAGRTTEPTTVATPADVSLDTLAKGTESQRPMDEVAPVDTAASVKAVAPKSKAAPKRKQKANTETFVDFPVTVKELEGLLPQFDGAAYGIIDEMDPDFDEIINELRSSKSPDMREYVRMELERSTLQGRAIKREWPEEGEASKAHKARHDELVRWKEDYGKQATLTAGDSTKTYAAEDSIVAVGGGLPSVTVHPAVDADGDVNMIGGDEGSEGSQLSGRTSPMTSGSSARESSVTSKSAGTKRSREWSSSSSGDDVVMKGTLGDSKGKGKRKDDDKVGSKKAKGSREVKRLATDAQFASPMGRYLDARPSMLGSRASLKPRKYQEAGGRPEYAGDMLKSFEAMQTNWDGERSPAGSQGSSQPSSRQSSQPSSRQSSQPGSRHSSQPGIRKSSGLGGSQSRGRK